MNLDLPFNGDVEAAIRAHAAATGLDVKSFIIEAIMDKLAESVREETRHADSASWADKLRQGINLHPVVNHFVDDSRESIYQGRGE